MIHRSGSLADCPNSVCMYKSGDEPVEEVTDKERKFRVTALMQSHECVNFWRAHRRDAISNLAQVVHYPVCKDHHDYFVSMTLPEVIQQLMQEKWIDYLTPTLGIDYESLYGERYGWT